MVFRQKIIEEGIFQIFMNYGNPKEVKNKIIYEEKLKIEEDTNITALLEKYQYELEFQVSFKKEPPYNFNTFKPYREKDDDYSYHDFDGYSHAEEEKFTLQECLQEMKRPEKLVEGN